VTPFPATGTKWQISTGGGTMPHWSQDGKEIYFMRPQGGNHLMVARVDATGPAVKRLEVRPLFPVTLGGGVRMAYAPSSDGRRFLVNTAAGTDPRPASPPIVVTDWLALRRESK
jgi:hypothetical protein